MIDPTAICATAVTPVSSINKATSAGANLSFNSAAISGRASLTALPDAGVRLTMRSSRFCNLAKPDHLRHQCRPAAAGSVRQCLCNALQDQILRAAASESVWSARFNEIRSLPLAVLIPDGTSLINRH